MLERFTVDALAGDLERQIQHAGPEPRFARRFFRRGKKDGRRELAFAPQLSFLTRAVQIATGKLAEAFVEERDALLQQLDALRAEAASSEDTPSGREGRGDWHSTGSETPSEQSQERRPIGRSDPARKPDLKSALETLREQRRAAERAAEIAADAAERDRRRAVSAQIAVLNTKVERLAQDCLVSVYTAHKAGQLIWSRYCTGYEAGSRGRGAPDDDGARPTTDVTFPVPEVLVSAEASFSTSDALPSAMTGAGSTPNAPESAGRT